MRVRDLAPDVPPGGAREQIFERITDTPGIHLRGIGRDTGLPVGQLVHHLDRLTRMKLVASQRDGGFLRYYAIGKVGRGERATIAQLHHETARRITVALLREPHLMHKDLQARLHVAASTVSFHLQRLLENGIIQRTGVGAGTTYHVRDSAHVRAVLAHHGIFEE